MIKKENFLKGIKENYFNDGILCELVNLGIRSDKLRFNIRKSALLVLDMQRFFCDPNSHAFIPSARIIIQNINDLCKVFKAENRPVYFSIHHNQQLLTGMMNKWWKDVIKIDSPFANLDGELDTSYGNKFIKESYDAFWETELDAELRKLEVNQIVICGVMTHLCCETTARSAFIRNYEVFFVIDGTATYNKNFHNAAILNLAHGFAQPVISKEIIKSTSNE